MFRTSVPSTPLTGSAADSFFKNISGDYYNGDCSFISTLRALVQPRMGEDDNIYLTHRSSNYSQSRLSSWTVSDAMRQVLFDPEYISNGNIVIHNFSSASADDNAAWMSLIKSSFEEKYEGWHALDKMTEFYRKSFYVLCYINPEIRSVYIFVDSLNLKKLHYLQCSIFAFLPWYFDPTKGVSEIEMELIQSLREKTAEKYMNCLLKIAEKYDFRSERIRSLLRGFETKYERKECASVKSQAVNILEKIKSLNSQIDTLLKQHRDVSIKLLGLEMKIESSSGEDSEIMDYFLTNKRLILEYVDDTYLKFIVNDYLLYFDEDMAKSMIENRNSYIYRSGSGTDYNHIIAADDMELLMKAIFIDQTLRLRFCAAYRFDMNGSVCGLEDYSFPCECSSSMPNIHIDGYSCLGNYHRVINDLLANGNYIGAIEQCIASCKSLNFADSTVMREFMNELYGEGSRNSTCIELPTGEVVDAKRAIQWLKHEVEEEADE